jgi:hypothetical protein
MKTKLCKDCGEEKPIERFSQMKNYNNTDTTYYKPYCKDCMTERMNKWREKNREKFLAYQAKWHRKYYKKKKV